MSAAAPWIGLPLLVVAAVAVIRALGFLHILQIEEYDVGRYRRWVRAEVGRMAPPARSGAGFVAAVALSLIAVTPAAVIVAVAGTVLWAALAIVAALRRSREPAKKPLRLTPRALLALGMTIVVAVAVGLAVAVAVWGANTATPFLAALVFTLVLEAFAPWLVAVGSLALWPAQVLAREAVILAARMRLARSRAVVIGITGSYGKTSTKEILAALLSSRYRVLKTPESYNTLLGVSKVILRELRPDHEFFVVEMGAYRRGEIARLCRLAPPRVGVLTAINPQHLERFGSIENIAKAKYELIEALPATGTAVINVDNERCRALADSTRHVPVVRYGLREDGGPTVTASDWRSEGLRSRFRLRAGDGAAVDVSLRLLGRHNVANFVGAAAAAMAVGLTPEDVARAAESIEPVPHRLQPIVGAGGVTVLDDAYNSNPDGARAALEVLRGFGSARKVIVTPGMIELGEREEQENREFGVAAAAVCDDVILVGPRRTRPIRDGLLAAGFSEERIRVVRGIGEVQSVLATIVGPGDVVLFENDLPDNYSE